VPGGSDYQGPSDALERYAAVVEQAGEPVKGAKNPYTSRNGHMFSFLDLDGAMALRLSDELIDEFLSRYESGPVIQYGSVMRGLRLCSRRPPERYRGTRLVVREGIRVDRNARTEGDQDVALTLGQPFDSVSA
jgi:hypothetical protein